MFVLSLCVFFFKQKTAYEMRISDWSSDVCSSDLVHGERCCASRCVNVGFASWIDSDVGASCVGAAFIQLDTAGCQFFNVRSQGSTGGGQCDIKLGEPVTIV